MEVVVSQSQERRLSKRFASADDHGISSARVRPGHDASLVDVSSSGALIETHHRLLPGSSIELQLNGQQRRASMRGRVVRCAVVRLRASGVWYRGAIAFEQALPWFAPPDAAYTPPVPECGECREGTCGGPHPV
jgi:hypothetical protein